MGSDDAAGIRLEPYDRAYLDLSWTWLHDPEIKALTLSPDFTRAQQDAFFASLPGRADYRIWGVATTAGEKIGASGIKHIDGVEGEVWLYLGERTWWGRGIGTQILALCEAEARALGLRRLYMKADPTNRRSIRAFEKMGYAADGQSPGDGLVQLGKALSA